MSSDNHWVTLVIDQGTSSTKIFLFNLKHELIYSDRIKHHIHTPAPGHFEVDPLSITEAAARLIKGAVQFSEDHRMKILSAGVAIQRSTFLFWDKDTLLPLTPALSWQDSRARDVVNDLQIHDKTIHQKTGAPLNAHFGGPKFLHLVRQNRDLATKVTSGKVFFGPLSAFLTHSLTGTPAVDASIASRILTMDLTTADWDSDLLALFEMPLDCLPPLSSTNTTFGQISINDHVIPLTCVIGDQQAALLGQGGWKTGNTAMNFGTSGSIQTNVGSKPIILEGLISSILYSTSGERTYLLEGTINACNSLFYWLEEHLNIPHREMRWPQRCSQTTTTGIFIPGFGGLAAPYWKDALPTIMEGYRDKKDVNEIIRSGMESIGFLVHDIWCLIQQHLSPAPKRVTASGGGAREPLLQFIADLTRLEIGHLRMKDQTALGVHYLLLKAADLDTSLPHPLSEKTSVPKMAEEERTRKIEQWNRYLLQAGITPVTPV
jgi:glycerol kinase